MDSKRDWGKLEPVTPAKPEMLQRITCAEEMFDNREVLSRQEIKGEAYHCKSDAIEVYSKMNRHKDSDNGKETARPGPVIVGGWLDLSHNANGYLEYCSWVQSVQVAVP